MTQTMQLDGQTRYYHTYIPASLAEKRPNGELVPVVIFLHGGESTAFVTQRFTQEGFNKLAEQEGFLVIYPDAEDKVWNDGRTNLSAEADDVQFISNMIDALVQTQNVDPSRVYVTGVSNGGLMANRLGVELSNKVAAVAPVISGMAPAIAKKVPENPTPVLMINGTRDRFYQADGTINNGKNSGKGLSVSSTIRRWIQYHGGLAGCPQSTLLPNVALNDGTCVVETVYPTQDGEDVVFYSVVGGGHTWPSGSKRRFLGKTTQDIDGAKVIWDFFKTHTLQPAQHLLTQRGSH